jgi:hypothetical protein
MNVRWRHWSLTILTILALASVKGYSQDKGFGLGVIIGEPTGLSGKYWLDGSHAIDMGLAYSFVHPDRTISLHADYLFHDETTLRSPLRLPVYYGFGARLHFGNGSGNSFGARGVVGVVWIPGTAPVDLFIELAPVFNLFPKTSLHIDLAIGGRYYFEK